MPEQHYISKFIFELQVSSQEEAHVQQNNAASIVRNELQHVLNGVFEKFDQPGKIIRISKLEIDISCIDFRVVDTDLVQVVRQKIEEEFNKILFQHELNKTVKERGISLENDLVIITDYDTELTQAILYFFQNGFLPAWVNYPHNFSISATVNNLSARQKKIFIDEMLKLFVKPGIVQRFYTQLPESILKEIIPEVVRASGSFADEVKMLLIEAVTSLPRSKQHFLKFISAHSKSRNPLNFYYYSLLRHLHTTANHQEIEKLIALLNHDKEYLILFVKIFTQVNFIPSENKVYVIKSLLDKPELKQYSRIIHDLFDPVLNLQQHIEGNDRATTGKKEDISSTDILLRTEGEMSNQEQNISGIKKRNVNGIGSEIDDELFFQREEQLSHVYNETPHTSAYNLPQDVNQEILIHYAGLVILQPYLLQFFRNIGLVEGNNFISEVQQHHAVYVLNYIATGIADQPEEHILVLHKLLCGIDLEIPLLPFAGIMENEVQECENLLAAVIENWSALKHTSVQTLRSSFIHREGVLRHESSGWMIHIGKVTIDVLLDKLPWGISMFRLPWNKEMIFVEW